MGCSTQRRVQFTRIDINAAQVTLDESAIQRHHPFKQRAPAGLRVVGVGAGR